MINYNYECNFKLKDENQITTWIKKCIAKEKASLSFINYIFCTDDYLYKLNTKFLKHYTYTDILTFDYSSNNRLSCDIFISIDRIKDNTEKYVVNFYSELHRVMIHGVLHCLGYDDKTLIEKKNMRKKEEELLNILN
ncbi:MAG: rRNA maturation RNase YbeY [Tenacibaculum sp.]